MAKIAKAKHRPIVFHFVAAALVYLWSAIELMVGALPIKSGKVIAENKDPYFFWIAVSLQFIGCFILIGFGIDQRLKRRANGDTSEAGQFLSNRTANILASALMIFIGLCFLILPINEMPKRRGARGAIFGRHLINKEPDAFHSIIYLHLILSLISICGGIALLFFNPPKQKSQTTV